jgi:hypothetical protein
MDSAMETSRSLPGRPFTKLMTVSLYSFMASICPLDASWAHRRPQQKAQIDRP